MEDGPAPGRQHRREATPMPPPPPQPKGREEDVSRAAGAAPWKEPSRGSRGFCEGRTEAGGRRAAPALLLAPAFRCPHQNVCPGARGRGSRAAAWWGAGPGRQPRGVRWRAADRGPRRRCQDALRPCAVSRGRGRRCCRRGRSTRGQGEPEGQTRRTRGPLRPQPAGVAGAPACRWGSESGSAATRTNEHDLNETVLGAGTPAAPAPIAAIAVSAPGVHCAPASGRACPEEGAAPVSG